MFTPVTRTMPGIRRGLPAGLDCQPALASRAPRVHRLNIYFLRLRRAGHALIGLLALSVSFAAAATNEPDALNLRQLIELAQHDNKDLQAARYAVEIGRARLMQAGLLPNPRLDLSARSDFAFKNEGEYAGSVGLSQQFPIAGRILRQKDVARVDVALAQAEVEEAERRLAGDVAADVYRLLVIDRQIQSRDQLMGIEEKLAKTTRDRMKAAEVSELDVNTVQLDLQRLSQERALLQSQHQSLTVSLNTLIGRPATSALEINEPLPEADTLPGREQLQAKAFASRPDIRSALLNADRAQAEKALAKAQRWEDWSIGVGLDQDKLVIDGAPPQSSSRAVGLSLSIPLPLFNKNQGLIAEAQANADQAKARVGALRLGVASEIVGAHAEAVNLQKLLNQYRQGLLPVSQRNVLLAQKGYSQGLVSVLEVVQAQRQQADLNAAYLNTLDQFLQALVRLRTAAGDYITAAPTGVTADTKEY
jgi:cobalt-zinc-cadmium efflux system outer membrane protein